MNVNAAQENLSYDITAVEERSTDTLLLIWKQLKICICSNELTEANIYDSTQYTDKHN
jgi:hypothetical protein